MSSILKKEDYEESACLLNMCRSASSIPVTRILGRLDEYLGRNDYIAAEKHLKYWIAEAEDTGDLRGKLTLLNELIGLTRKTGNAEESFSAISTALDLAHSLDFDRTVTMGTTLVNAATAYKAFGKPEDALSLYQQAQEIYEQMLSPSDFRFGGLYNNMALTVMELGNYQLAEDLFQKALSIMSSVENGELECAITCCNLCDLASAEVTKEEDAEERISMLLEKAWEYLETNTLPRNGYYAFVCEKCAPTFGYYGFFLYERLLKERADAIYARN